MRILILGSKGMLGRQLVADLSGEDEGWEIIGLGRQECDITDPQAIERSISLYRPDLVLHTAAYTDVDGCELNPRLAYQVNSEGTKLIAKSCKESSARLLYISTDYVFDGKKDRPYRPDDTPNPINEYGRSKLLGELHIQELLDDYLIIRTAWLFGTGKRNFVSTIVELAKQERPLRVVEDQVGSPTYTQDLSLAIKEIITLPIRGIIHITNQGSCSRYEMASEILRQLSRVDLAITPLSSTEIDRPAKRPPYSVLDISNYLALTGKPLPSWQEAIGRYLKAEGYA